MILQESDPEKRADLLAIALTLASRIFDKEFLRRFFREELVQMEHATLIDEWLEEAVQEAEKKASYEGRLEQAIRSIILILTIRFKITDVQEENFLNRLKQITDITALNALEEDALRAFNLDSFHAALNHLQTHPNSESVQ